VVIVIDQEMQTSRIGGQSAITRKQKGS